MSEEILRALMQLFAIIAKQDEGVESTQVEYVKNFLQQQLNDEEVKEYFSLFMQYKLLCIMLYAQYGCFTHCFFSLHKTPSSSKSEL